MKRILMIARNFDRFGGHSGLIFLLKKRGYEIVETIHINEFLDASTKQSEFDLLIVLCEHQFLVREILSLPDNHVPVVCIDIFDTEFMLSRHVGSMKDVSIVGFTIIDEELKVIDKYLRKNQTTLVTPV